MVKEKDFTIYIKESKRGYYTYVRAGKIYLAEFVPSKNSKRLIISIDKANKSLDLIKRLGFKDVPTYEAFVSSSMTREKAKKMPNEDDIISFPIKIKYA